MNYTDINSKTIDSWIEEAGNGEDPSIMKPLKKQKMVSGKSY